MPLYPLKFKPHFVKKIWGGRRIEHNLQKGLPAGQLIGEAWELYDFPPGVVEESTDWVSVVVANGPLAGRSLHSILLEYGPALFGKVAPIGSHGQFPILIKFLDAREDLSVQVHPDETYAAANPHSHLKNEAWYVLAHEPGAKIYKGLKPGTTGEMFGEAVRDGTVMDFVEAIPVKVGDCFYLPSGTVHALGAGVLVAEVQTPSDTTFRVFDFNRIEESTKKPRKLHVKEALECIDFSGKTEASPPRSHVAGLFTTVTRLVTCPYFTLEKVRFAEGVHEAVPYDQPVVWIMLEGNARLTVADLAEPVDLTKGDTVLLPAEMKQPMVQTLTDCVWLEVTLPGSE
jgi:mannose-6-phosphate isomerase